LLIYTGAEIDYVEETCDGVFGYEIKLGNKSARVPKTWVDEYNGKFRVINRENYLDWLLEA